jgi:hypothetical protein
VELDGQEDFGLQLPEDAVALLFCCADADVTVLLAVLTARPFLEDWLTHEAVALETPPSRLEGGVSAAAGFSDDALDTSVEAEFVDDAALCGSEAVLA